MANNRTYEEYEPAVEWSRTAEADTVKLSLPGFKKEDIRVLVDNHGHLRTRGERPIVANRWSRFQKDLELPANCNADGIRAKFENERLTITLPKNAPSPPMPAPPRRPPRAAPPAVPEQAARPTAPPPTVPAAPAPSVKPPAEPRRSMPMKPYAPVPAPPPAPAPEVEQPATTKPKSPLGAVQQEEEKQRVREAEGKMAEDRKKEMVQQDHKATEQQEAAAMPGEMALVNQPRPASASRGLLVNVAVAVVVLLGITVYVWHSLRKATGGAGEHSHGHLGAGSYRDEM